MFKVKGWHVLVVGMARSGRDAVKLLAAKGANVYAYDAKKISDIEQIDEILPILTTSFFGVEAPEYQVWDLVVLSPGVPPTLAFIQQFRATGVRVIPEVELAYLFSKGRFIGITGTNGKTTTTTLTGEIFKSAGFKVCIAGNIGYPLSAAVLKHDAQDVVYITELSSYQLELVDHFNIWIGALLNITPDHLKRHQTMANYIHAKLNMVRHLKKPNHFILNGDDVLSAPLLKRYPQATIFSKSSQNAKCVVENGHIIIKEKQGVLSVLPVKEIFIKGEHNLENALAATTIAYFAGISIEVIAKVLRTFKGVAHRNEYVGNFNGLSVYNDSKATNPEASIPALKAMDQATILIAGGMDKGSDFTPLLDHLQNVYHIVLLGETKYLIAEILENAGYASFSLANDMEQAILLAKALAKSPMNILLSPACASWDMYKDFEERGAHFKQCIERVFKHGA